jgi:GNAT superfamily N-acetyltransferase
MDHVRQKVFIDAITAAEKRHFASPEWGEVRMELADLACDPAYQRRGAGRALTEWGLREARGRKLPVMLTASPMGREVYRKLGFRDLEHLELGVEGEEERVGIWVMVWTPEGWEEPGES